MTNERATSVMFEDSEGKLEISIAIAPRKRSGVNTLKLPTGEDYPYSTKPKKITTKQLNLIRSMNWIQELEAGIVESIKELAQRYEVDPSYVNRIINMANLAPDIVEMILDDTLPEHVSLFDLQVDLPRLWDDQRKKMKLAPYKETPNNNR